jgi:purine-binding chemotaxis protein CheW
MADGESRDAVEEAEVAEPGRGLLTLQLGEAQFGVWVDEVLEIVRTPPISRLPLPDPEVAGVTSVRGELIPVLDLGVRLMGTPAVRPGRLVLIRHDDTATIVGLLVDGVRTLAAVRESEIEESPKSAKSGLPPGMVTGVVADTDGVTTILHLGRAAAPPETSEGED